MNLLRFNKLQKLSLKRKHFNTYITPIRINSMSDSILTPVISVVIAHSHLNEFKRSPPKCATNVSATLKPNENSASHRRVCWLSHVLHSSFRWKRISFIVYAMAASAPLVLLPELLTRCSAGASSRRASSKWHLKLTREWHDPLHIARQTEHLAPTFTSTRRAVHRFIWKQWVKFFFPKQRGYTSINLTILKYTHRREQA